jgi:hypothetical protein
LISFNKDKIKFKKGEIIMKQRLQGFFIGVVVMSIFTGVVAFATPQMVEVAFNNIKIMINGKQVESDVQPFIYNGRTYVPARAVAEGMGGYVNWDSNTNTVDIFDVNKTKLIEAYNSHRITQNTMSIAINNLNFKAALDGILNNDRNSEAFKTYYDTFKTTKDAFDKTKDIYRKDAIELIENSINEININNSKKFLMLNDKMEESIKLIEDIIVVFDYNKLVQYYDKMIEITQLTSDIRIDMMENAVHLSY